MLSSLQKIGGRSCVLRKFGVRPTRTWQVPPTFPIMPSITANFRIRKSFASETPSSRFRRTLSLGIMTGTRPPFQGDSSRGRLPRAEAHGLFCFRPSGDAKCPNSEALRAATHVGRAFRPCRLEKTSPKCPNCGGVGAFQIPSPPNGPSSQGCHVLSISPMSKWQVLARHRL